MTIISEFIELWKTPTGKQCIEAISNIQLSESGGTLLPELCDALNCPEIADLLKGGGYKRLGKDKGYAYEHMLRLASIANFLIEYAPLPDDPASFQSFLLGIFPAPAGATSINPDLMIAGVGIELKTTSKAEFGHFGVQCFVTAGGPMHAYWAPIPSTSQSSTYVKMGSVWTEAEFEKVRCEMRAGWVDGWESRMCIFVREQQRVVEIADMQDEGTGESSQRMNLSANITKVICPEKLLSILHVARGAEVLLFNGMLPVHGDCVQVPHTQAEQYYKEEKKGFSEAYMTLAKKDRTKRAKALRVSVADLKKSDKKIADANAKVEAVLLTMEGAFMDDHPYSKITPTANFKNQMEMIAYGKTMDDGGEAADGKTHRGAQLLVAIPTKDFADGYAIKKCQFIQVGTLGLYSCGAPVQLTDVVIPSFQSFLGEGATMRFRGAEKGSCFGSVVFDVSFKLGTLQPSPFNLNNPRELGRKQFVSECIIPVYSATPSSVLVTIGHSADTPLTPQALSIPSASASNEITQRSLRILNMVTSQVCPMVSHKSGGGGGGGGGGGSSGGGDCPHCGGISETCDCPPHKGGRRRRKRRTKRRTKRKRTKRKRTKRKKRRKRRKRRKTRRRRRNSHRKK